MYRCEEHNRPLTQAGQERAWICPDCLLKTARSLITETQGQRAQIVSLKESLHAARQECHGYERRLEALKERIASRCDGCGMECGIHTSACPVFCAE